MNSPFQEQSPTDISTVQRILHNALDHFSRFGYVGASVREITQASEVTKPSLYYYFKNKEELYKKLADSCFQEILAEVEKAAQIGGTTYQRIMNVINEYCRLCGERKSVVRFVHHLTINQTRHVPDVGAMDFRARIQDHFGRIIDDGVKAGEVPEAQAVAILYAVLGIFFLRVESLLFDWRQAPDTKVVEDAVSKILS